MRVAELHRFLLVTVFAVVAVASACGEAIGTGRRLRFQTVAPTVAAGSEFTVNVEIVSPNGARETRADDVITLALEDPGSLVLIGETTVTAADGLATFSGLVIEQTGSALRFVAETGPLTAFSGEFAVEAGPVSPDASSVSPPPGTIPPNGLEFTFAFVDAYGNAVANADISLSSSLAGSAFTPASGQTSLTGEFAAVLNSSAEGSTDVTATVQGIPITVDDPYTLVELCPGPLSMAFPGTVDGVQPCGPYSPGVPAPSVYEFTTAGGGASFTITSTFQPLFQVKLNATSDDVLFTALETPATVEWLLPAGTYLFSVGTANVPGDFTVTGQAVPGNVGAVDRYLVTGGSYGGQSLDANDSQIQDDSSYYDAFFFRSASACTVTLRSAEFRPYLMLVDGITGARLTADVTTPIGVDAVSSLPVCRSGEANPVAIIANARGTGETGAYTVILSVAGGGALQASARSRRVALPPVSAGRGGLREVIQRTALRKKP